MSDASRKTSSPLVPAAAARQKGRAARIVFRTSVLAILIGMILLAVDWRQRQAVWSIVFAGGTISATTRADPTTPTNSEADRGSPRSGSVIDRIRNGWLPTDERVFGVNLSQTTVDQKWLYHLETLYGLEILAVDARQIGPELARLGHIPTLRQLKIISPDQGTPLRHLLALQRLEQLQIVNPSGPIDDFVELGTHPTLRELEFEAVGPTAENWAALLEQCRNWPLLEVVRIRSQFALSPGLDALRSCPSLTTLELSAPLTRQDMAIVAGMSQLTDVVLNAKKLEDADLLSLGSLGKIKTLKIYSEGIHEQALDELRRLLPHCDLDSGP